MKPDIISVRQRTCFEALLSRPENRECFDCGARQPRWASTNLGIFFCLRCAGIHRSMGTHISKVKSTNMDLWDEDMLLVAERIGNTRGRLLYEYSMPSSMKATHFSSTAVLDQLIRSKYEKRQYYHPDFESVWNRFMDSPIASLDGGASHAASVQQHEQQNKNAIPAPMSAPQELWIGPVAPPTSHVPVPQSSKQEVAELFSLPPHLSPSAGYNTAGHRGFQNTGSAYPVTGFYPSTPAVGGVTSTTTVSNVCNYGTLATSYPAFPLHHNSPATGQHPTPQNGNATAHRTFSNYPPHGNPHTNNSGTVVSEDSKREILSLFSAPSVAGVRSNPGFAMAWKPQEVRTYYAPDK